MAISYPKVHLCLNVAYSCRMNAIYCPELYKQLCPFNLTWITISYGIFMRHHYFVRINLPVYGHDYAKYLILL